jgi:hypothetical protein
VYAEQGVTKEFAVVDHHVMLVLDWDILLSSVRVGRSVNGEVGDMSGLVGREERRGAVVLAEQYSGSIGLLDLGD